MKMMRQNDTAVLKGPGTVGLTKAQPISRCRRIIRQLALCAAFMHCLASTQGADNLAGSKPDGQPAQARTPGYTPQACQMQRYKAFARQAELPPVAVTNGNLVTVGGVVKLDVTQLPRLTRQEQEALAARFSVPTAVITNVVQHTAGSSSPDAAQLAQDLRTAVIDYRFLQIEWDRYHPPTAGQPTKAAALAALQAGDISKAWELYDGLQRPAPPANLRVVAAP